MDLKKKLKKGTFSGVIPMMGMFIMAAVMAFQSIPISEAVGDQLSESFTDLSRVAETKSYGDLYFFNFVPNGAEHSLNNISYSLGKDGGNVSWSHNTFDPDNNIETDVENRVETIIEDKLEPKTESYFNERYGGVSQGNGCTIPSINYTTIPLPDSESDYTQGVENNPENIPMVVRSQVETEGSSYFYSGGEAAPIEVECLHGQGATKYIGDTQSESETSTTTGTGTGTGTGGLSTGFGGLGGFNFGYGFFPGNWVSLGYTNRVEASANRFHVLTEQTTRYFKNLHDEWVQVKKETGKSQYVCSLGSNEWKAAKSEANNDIENKISSGRTKARNSVDLYEGIEIKNKEITSSSDFGHGITTQKYKGTISTSTESGGCVCDCGRDCCYDEKRAVATITPQKSVVDWKLKDEAYKVQTRSGWKNLKFKIKSYNHDFQEDS
jgi:hypothetical protein